MKKKIALVFGLLIILVCGCTVEPKEDTEAKELQLKRETYISNLGVTTDDKVVIKYKNGKDEECYYIFFIKGKTYTQKQITLHRNEDSYKSAVRDYETSLYYQLIKNDEVMSTEITLKKDYNVGDKKVKSVIENKYKDDDKFEIIK